MIKYLAIISGERQYSIQRIKVFSLETQKCVFDSSFPCQEISIAENRQELKQTIGDVYVLYDDGFKKITP